MASNTHVSHIHKDEPFNEVCMYCKVKFNDWNMYLKHRRKCRPDMLSPGFKMQEAFSGEPLTLARVLKYSQKCKEPKK